MKTKNLRPLAIAATLALICAALLFALRPKPLGIQADSENLPAIGRLLRDNPPPRGWRLAEPGEKTKVDIKLGASYDAGLGDGAHRAGKRWKIPLLAAGDPRGALSLDKARSLGLVDLSKREPGTFVVEVDGRWPGEEGYAFTEHLSLAIVMPQGRRAPKELANWCASMAASYAQRLPRPIRIAAAGDIVIKPGQSAALRPQGPGLKALLDSGLCKKMIEPDILVGNLEGPVSSRGAVNPKKRFRFRMPPGTAAALAEAGFDVLLFANNHGLDFGPEAFADTLSEFGNGPARLVGAGLDSMQALEGLNLRAAETELVFFGFAHYPRESLDFTTEEAAAGPAKPGINADEAATLEAIHKEATAGKTVVVLAHGGQEFEQAVQPEIRMRYRAFAKAGARLVIGSHPHVLQEIERQGDSLIAYSLGNFIFTGTEMPPQARTSALVEFLLYEGRAVGFRSYPIVVSPQGTHSGEL